MEIRFKAVRGFREGQLSVAQHPDSVPDIIRPIMAHLFELEEAAIVHELSRDEVDLWDSLNHLRLIAAAESEFEVSFPMSELIRLNSFGEIVAAVRSKLR